MNRAELLINKQNQLHLISSSFPSISTELEIDAKYEIEGVGFLAPIYKNESIWGRNCWFTFSNFATTSPAASKRLFTEVSKFEASKGVNHFYVEVPANNPSEIQAWFELGFGAQHMSAILGDIAKTDSSAKIRNATIEDIPAILEVERELAIHQMDAPVFSNVQPDDEAESAKDWRELFDSKENNGFVVKVAEVENQVVALSYGVSTEKSQLHSGILRPANSATLAHSTTIPKFRGKGIGKALAAAVINDLRAKGFSEIVTDWRVTNQLSSVTWPKLGFIPTVLRLHRAL
jgi:ribosomal protein S18 acetylase RimI-like enzyme